MFNLKEKLGDHFESMFTNLGIDPLYGMTVLCLILFLLSLKNDIKYFNERPDLRSKDDPYNAIELHKSLRRLTIVQGLAVASLVVVSLLRMIGLL